MFIMIRLNYKRISIWILFCTQILLITSYFYLNNPVNNYNSNEKVSFIQRTLNDIEKQENARLKLTYHTSLSRIYLRNINTQEDFIDFNSSLCYINGTDLASMKRSNDLKWQCKCLPGWHGKDCGQPEIIWRALLTYRKPMKLLKTRLFQRRLIYIFEASKYSETITHIRINELKNIVDLFVLYGDQIGAAFFDEQFKSNRWQSLHDKILYLIHEDTKEDLWPKLHKTIKNLRDDDIILTSDFHEIPNKFALNFLKFYDNFPPLIRFRYKWTVYGFYWMYPNTTIIMGAATSIGYFKQNFNNKLNALNDNKLLSNSLYKSIILGDLNHYGGWYCEYCFESSESIVEFLHHKTNSITIELKTAKSGKQIIDKPFIEDCIENGLYVDGRIQLKRVHKYQDNYFAPYYILDNKWEYDFLLVNFYSKIDY